MKLNVFKKKKEEKTTTKIRKINIKKIVTISVIAVLVVALVFFYFFKIKTKKVSTNEVKVSQVQKGDIELVISGTGTIKANEQYNVTSLVRGEIVSAPFKEGDTVKKGDILYKIDKNDAQNAIERSKINLEKSKNSYNQSLRNRSKLTVTSPANGNITKLYVKLNDSISPNTKIADMVDTKNMILVVPFISEHSNQIAIGSQATVTLQGTNDIVYGNVTRIATGTQANANGVEVRNMEITVANPGGIKGGDKATAIIGDVSCNDLGAFKNNNETSVLAETEGKIVSLPFKEGDYVNSGEELAHLSSDNLSDTITSSELAIKDANLALDNSYDTLEDYDITSPITGTVIQKTSKAGDSLDNTMGQVSMAIIADMSKILFDIPIDELDIARIKIGQEVKVTVDALPDKQYVGYVDKISIVGTSTDGVTTYPITVLVQDPQDLIPGMNVSADITVEKKTNILKVPKSAVQRGNFVAIKDENAPKTPATKATNSPITSKTTIPVGFKKVNVKTGISDSEFIEIIDGLKEGQKVWIKEAKSASLEEQMMTMQTEQRVEMTEDATKGTPMSGHPGGGKPSN